MENGGTGKPQKIVAALDEAKCVEIEATRMSWESLFYHISTISFLHSIIHIFATIAIPIAHKIMQTKTKFSE